MSFSIRYEISSDAWKKAATSRFNPRQDPLYYQFYGNVSIECDGRSFFRDRVNLSIADLACQLAEALTDGFPSSKARFIFRQGDGELEITFDRRVDQVEMRSNENESMSLNVSEFTEGASEFVSDFARKLAEHVPDAFEWRELRVLRPFS